MAIDLVMTIDDDELNETSSENFESNDLNPKFLFSTKELDIKINESENEYEDFYSDFSANSNEQKEEKGDEEDKEDKEEEETNQEDQLNEIVVSDNEEEEIEDKVLEKKKLSFFESVEENELGFTSFSQLNLSRPLVKALNEINFKQPTKIQTMTIPIALAGKDICGAANTGSGKTAAFLIPIIERLVHKTQSIPAIRVLILMPTRELAAQCYSVGLQLAKYTDITFALLVGGLSNQQQELVLKKRPDIIIATPGRLIDHLQNSANFGLETIEILVMDEADRMLEDGFQAELQEIIRNCPKNRQTLLFSATMTDNVDKLISICLNKPVRLFIDSTKSVTNKLIQEFIRIRPPTENNEELAKQQSKSPHLDLFSISTREAVVLSLCSRTFNEKTIIFFPSKSLCHRMRIIFGLFNLSAAELHGNLNQLERLEALESFKKGNVQFLLCTDLAARGLDIAGIETVINFQMPPSFERYIHRVGRTARYEKEGIAVSLVGEKERKMMKTIMKNLKPGQVARQRVIPYPVIKKFREKIENIEDKVKSILAEEKEEKEFKILERDLKKAQNYINHASEINARPKKSWFQSGTEKLNEKRKGREEKAEEEDNFKKILKEEEEKILKQEKYHNKFSGLSRKQKRKRNIK